MIRHLKSLWRQFGLSQRKPDKTAEAGGVMDMESNGNLSAVDKYVIDSVLANNEYNITRVNDLKSVKSMPFVQEDYLEFEKLIKEGDTNAIKAFQTSQPDSAQPGFREYLEIMAFRDQDNMDYIVTVYDSDAIWQDPQVIKIFRVVTLKFFRH